VNWLGVKKREKSVTDLAIERSIEVLGCTFDERSEENLKWMREHGYIIKKSKRGSRRRGR